MTETLDIVILISVALVMIGTACFFGIADLIHARRKAKQRSFNKHLEELRSVLGDNYSESSTTQRLCQCRRDSVKLYEPTSHSATLCQPRREVIF